MTRQTRMSDYLTHVPVVMVPLHTRPESNRGLSERILRRRLERQGWTVWRGGIIGIERTADAYPSVQRKYAMLRELLDAHRPGLADEFEYLCRVHHGMPDFLCHRRGEWKFVECKFRHEQLSNRQRHCIRKLQGMGFMVEVHILVHDETKARLGMMVLETRERIVKEQQRRLVMKWPSTSRRAATASGHRLEMAAREASVPVTSFAAPSADAPDTSRA